MTKDRTRSRNALNSLVHSNDHGIDARRKLSPVQIEENSRWREREEELALGIARAEAVCLNKHVLGLGEQLKSNDQKLVELVKVSAAAPLLEGEGVPGGDTCEMPGGVVARGTGPQRICVCRFGGRESHPASSGNKVRHRLNRGVDRRLNSALHMAAVTRMTHDTETFDDVEKRRAEGKNDKEIRR